MDKSEEKTSVISIIRLKSREAVRHGIAMNNEYLLQCDEAFEGHSSSSSSIIQVANKQSGKDNMKSKTNRETREIIIN